MTFKKLARPVPHLYHATLFELSEPITCPGISSSYVVASWDPNTANDEPENYYVFLSNQYGNVLSWTNIANNKDAPYWLYQLGYM